MSFQDLVVWQRAVEPCVSICKLTASFPNAEQFGLTAQMRRASVSIASNIAEGYGRATKGEYLQLLGLTRGSVCQLQTQLILAKELGLGTGSMREFSETLSADVSRLLIAPVNKLRR